MLYKFKSGASGDVIMAGDRGEQLLAIIGKPPASQGIVTADALPAALRALEAAVAAEEAGPADPEHLNVALRQRAWPLVEMFRRSQLAQVPVVWGV